MQQEEGAFVSANLPPGWTPFVTASGTPGAVRVDGLRAHWLASGQTWCVTDGVGRASLAAVNDANRMLALNSVAADRYTHDDLDTICWLVDGWLPTKETR